MKKLFSIIIVILSISVFALLLSNCKSENAPNLEKLKIGYMPSLAASPLFYAKINGYFKDEGLDVEFKEIYSGPEVITSLQSKDVDIGFGIVPSIILSRANGLKIKSVYGATIDGKDIQEHRLILPIDSPIKSAADLKGKKIAIVAEPTSDSLSLMDYLERNGLSSKDVELVKTPHPEQIFAVASKTIDAGASIEPFITIGYLQKKIKIFDFYYSDDVTEVGTYMMHEDVIAAKKDVIEKFRKAMRKAAEFCNNKEKLRKFLPTLEKKGIPLKISAEVANIIHITEFRDSVSIEGVKKVMDQCLKRGFLKKAMNPEDCIYK